MKIDKNTEPSEVQIVLCTAAKACQSFKIPQMCTEALLYAITDNVQLTGYNHLKMLGVNVVGLKKMLAKRLKTKSIEQRVRKVVYSTSVQGTLFLNGNNTSSLHLLTTIVQHNNTAAARLLRSERILLNPKNELIYNPN